MKLACQEEVVNKQLVVRPNESVQKLSFYLPELSDGT